MQALGGRLLEGLLEADPGHRGNRVDCGKGHLATFVGYRGKTLDTVVGPVRLNRAYYHCGDCRGGVVPRDAELGVEGASLSPGLERMVARVGAAQPFAKASGTLAELAGVELTPKRVERSSEANGGGLASAAEREAAAVLAGDLLPLGHGGPVEKLYVAMDGTGSPPCPPTPRAGRAGPPTGGPGPGRSSWAACSHRPGWTRRGARSRTPAPRAT